jgi:branched-chain amino acid transport system ATP-binding protein
MKPLLSIVGLDASYGQVQVLRNLSLKVEQGGISVLLGANGAGKTTTLRAISGLWARASGVIDFDGKSIVGMKTEDVARAGVAHVPDGRGTFVNFTVEENLRVAATTRRDKQEVAQDIERVFSYFPRLKERYSQQAGTLSGGEQQMLAISRALMLRPKLLLLDEPSFGLAPLVVRDIFEIIKAINSTDKVGVLLVEQNVALALDVADEAYLLEQGQIALFGTPDSFRDSEVIQNVYLAC